MGRCRSVDALGKGTKMEVEYQDGEVRVTSRQPLKGLLELAGEDDETYELYLDRDRAMDLVSVLVAFLNEGEPVAGSA